MAEAGPVSRLRVPGRNPELSLSGHRTWKDGQVLTSDRLPARLTAEIRACGYFPDLIAGAVDAALGGEELMAHLVHHEATFNREEISRHLTVLGLTPTRLIVGHTDENEGPGEPGQAVTTTEVIPLSRISAVSVSQVVDHPERYGRRGSAVVETWLTIGWGTMRRIDLEPASCGDPTCDADHGLTGTLAADDLTVRISAAADGQAKVADLLSFGAAIQGAARG